MEVARHDDHENHRVANLESYAIMDSGPEVSFDQLAYLASTICETPIALISFIDFDRQWFKSSVGIELHEIPRYLSACNQTINQKQPYVISDIKNEGEKYREFMLKEGFHFYAGVPISSPEGHNLGTLCVIDYEPKILTNDQIQTLKVIASQVIDLLEVRKSYRENLKRLKDLGETRHRLDRHYEEAAHKAGIRAMAELSAGLSYRIRPYIMAIQGVESRLEKMIGPGPEVSNELKILTDSSEEIFHIVDSLEKFILAEKERAMKLMDLNEALKTVLKFLEYKFKKFDIELVCHIERDLRCIGNISQIKEVFYAVINNSIEAVMNMKHRKIEISVNENNHWISIYVKDSGKGIEESVRPFIFQPFFTTKGPQGQGIGLSLAQSLLQRHSGAVRLVRPYKPTCFCICIPSP